MTSNFRDNHSPASLMAQITDTERKILDQRRSVRLHASMLDRNIRKRLTSPAMLLLAAGVGFIAGKLTKRQAGQRKEGSRDIGGSPAPDNNFLETVLKVVSLVRGSLLPMLVAAMGSSPKSDTPGDTPKQWPPAGTSSSNNDESYDAAGAH